MTEKLQNHKIHWEFLSEGQQIKADTNPNSDIWWVRLKNGACALTVGFSCIVDMDLSKIRFNGAKTQLGEKDGRSVFFLVLNEKADLDIFTRFGEDLINVLPGDKNQKYADALFTRLKQWMRFLQKEQVKTIEMRKQLGLMGELSFLELIHNEYAFTYADLLAAWQGPEMSSKDFMFADFFAEVKSCFNDETVVHISNEKQLMPESKPAYLICYRFTQDSSADDLSERIARLRENIASEDENLIVVFEQKLLALGYNPAIAYQNLISLRETDNEFYQIKDGFPCIQITDIPEGVSNVKYELDLAVLHRFMVQKIIAKD